MDCKNGDYMHVNLVHVESIHKSTSTNFAQL